MFIFSWPFLLLAVLLMTMAIVVASHFDKKISQKLYYGKIGPLVMSALLVSIVFFGSLAYAWYVVATTPANQLKRDGHSRHHF
jgi:hypothetical protein